MIFNANATDDFVSRSSEMANVKHYNSDEEEEIVRERRMMDSGEYESVDLSFAHDLLARAAKLKAEVESATENETR